MTTWIDRNFCWLHPLELKLHQSTDLGPPSQEKNRRLRRARRRSSLIRYKEGGLDDEIFLDLILIFWVRILNSSDAGGWVGFKFNRVKICLQTELKNGTPTSPSEGRDAPISSPALAFWTHSSRKTETNFMFRQIKKFITKRDYKNY